MIPVHSLSIHPRPSFTIDVLPCRPVHLRQAARIHDPASSSAQRILFLALSSFVSSHFLPFASLPIPNTSSFSHNHLLFLDHTSTVHGPPPIVTQNRSILHHLATVPPAPNEQPLPSPQSSLVRLERPNPIWEAICSDSSDQHLEPCQPSAVSLSSPCPQGHKHPTPPACPEEPVGSPPSYDRR